MREAGWYEIRFCEVDPVENAYWNGGFWEISGLDTVFSDDFIDWIGPRIEGLEDEEDIGQYGVWDGGDE